jgi:hypothetical protein
MVAAKHLMCLLLSDSGLELVTDGGWRTGWLGAGLLSGGLPHLAIGSPTVVPAVMVSQQSPAPRWRAHFPSSCDTRPGPKVLPSVGNVGPRLYSGGPLPQWLRRCLCQSRVFRETEPQKLLSLLWKKYSEYGLPLRPLDKCLTRMFQDKVWAALAANLSSHDPAWPPERLLSAFSISSYS